MDFEKEISDWLVTLWGKKGDGLIMPQAIHFKLMI
jgi:hypothetical protein